MMRGAIGEFDSPESLLQAIRRIREDESTPLEAWAPYPVHGLEEALGIPRSRIPIVAGVVGFAAVAGAFALQWWMNGIDYPLDVGGRPLNSWPAWLIICFEMGILAAGLTTFFGCLFAIGLPRLWHPVAEVEGFERASVDRFFLAIADPDGAELLRAAGALRVTRFGEVEEARA